MFRAGPRITCSHFACLAARPPPVMGDLNAPLTKIAGDRKIFAARADWKLMVKQLKELSDLVGGKIEGNVQLDIRGVASLGAATPADISFLANPRYEKQLAHTRAAAVIVGKDVAANGKTLLRCKDPYDAFRQIMVAFYGFRRHGRMSSLQQACIDPSVTVGDGANIAPNVTIEAGVTIGRNVTLYPGVYIGQKSKIGNDTTLYPHVTIYDGCTIGDRVTLHAGTVIGNDGFGYATVAGVHHKIPQVGGVIIEDDVEMGSCCVVDRGTFPDEHTIIRHGTKFSNSVVIGHNTEVGSDSLFVAQVGVAGSTHIGQHAVFGGQVGVVGHLQIGTGVTAAAQSGIANNLESGSTVMGSPAGPITQHKRSWVVFSQLPDIRKRLRRIEEQLDGRSEK